MRRRIASMAGVVLLAGTMLVGLRPTPAAAEAVQSMTGSLGFHEPPTAGSSFCATVSGPVLMTVVGTSYTGPVYANGFGTVCGVWPITVSGTVWITGTVNAGPVTVNVNCSLTMFGTLPGTVTYTLSCLITATTPFGTTSQSLCATGVGTLLFSPGIYLGVGLSPCP